MDGDTWPTPCSMPESASCDRHRGAVVPGDGGLLVLPLEQGLPVSVAPDGGVGRVDRDDDQARVEGHRAQAFPESGGGDARDGAAELLPPGPAAHGLAAGGAGVVEAEVLDRDACAVVGAGDTQELGDLGPQASVSLGGGAGQVEGDGDRLAGRVAVRVEDVGGEVVGVQVDTEQTPAGLAELLRRGEFGRLRTPGRVEVPAVAGRVGDEVVADGLVRGDAVAPLLAAVVEGDGEGERMAAAGRAGQVSQRFGQHHLDGPGDGVDADGVVAVQSPGLAVSGEEQPLGLPLLTPLLLGQARFDEVVPGPEQAPTTDDDPRASSGGTGFDCREAGGEDLKAALLLEAFGLVRVAAYSSLGTSTARGGQTVGDDTDGPAQTGLLVEQGTQAQAGTGLPRRESGRRPIARSRRR
ncbi:hypothetical protein [Streptomyces vinaceus]|uniref:hypothetical protein n=1 Tax=Streptomyces vinaceus TaxID=1960 RepID=UPI0036ACF015